MTRINWKQLLFMLAIFAVMCAFGFWVYIEGWAW